MIYFNCFHLFCVVSQKEVWLLLICTFTVIVLLLWICFWAVYRKLRLHQHHNKQPDLGASGGGSQLCSQTDRQPLGGVHFDHSSQKVLTVWRDEVRHVENSQLHLLQKVPQVVIIKWQRALKNKRGSQVGPLVKLSVIQPSSTWD